MTERLDLSTWISKNAAFSPTKPATLFEDMQLTYADLDQRINSVAYLLQNDCHIEIGDRVGLLAHNCVEYITLLFACARLGAILTPMNWRLAVPELTYIAQDAGLKVLFVEEAFQATVEPIQQELPDCQLVGFDFEPQRGQMWTSLFRDECPEAEGDGSLDAPLLLPYTSGTTGRPKGALLTQSNLHWNSLNAVHMQSMSSEDHALTVLPLFHAGGLNNQSTPILYVGGTLSLHRRFDPTKTLQTIHGNRPTITCLVPAMMAACISSPLWEETDFSNLRLNVTGSTLVPDHLSDRFREKGVTVVEMYGLTETAPVSVYHRADSDFSKRGSTGLPGLHSEIRIVDLNGHNVPVHEKGEVLIKGPNVMSGYWQNPGATKDAFDGDWFRTGDIGYQDGDGYLYITDRRTNMIISGSENIYAAEVERVLYEHPAVAECALIGKPDPQWGEIPVAFVVVQPGEQLSTEHLKDFLKSKLARYKQPKAYEFIDDLPKNAMGKVLHYVLREQMAAGL
ncbi:MAG: long-chain fatty acid--CoA ligase [Chloroflexota bacterium]